MKEKIDGDEKLEKTIPPNKTSTVIEGSVENLHIHNPYEAMPKLSRIQIGLAIALFVVGAALMFTEIYWFFLDPYNYHFRMNGPAFWGLLLLFLVTQMVFQKRKSVSSLLSPRLPFGGTDKNGNLEKEKGEAFQLSEQDFESIKTKIRFELKKTKILVEYSNLSVLGKSQCHSLLTEAENSLKQAQAVSELKYISELIELASKLKDAIDEESRTILGYVAFIIFMLVLLAWRTWNQWDAIAFENFLFGVPLGVLIWSGIGGFMSLPYRYIFQREEFQEPTAKWLIIRPVMGLVLGTVTYFAFSSSLFVLGENLKESLATDRSAILLILAFLSGFSDKFAIFILETVIGRIAPGWKTKPKRLIEQDTVDEIELSDQARLDKETNFQ